MAARARRQAGPPPVIRSANKVRNLLRFAELPTWRTYNLGEDNAQILIWPDDAICFGATTLLGGRVEAASLPAGNGLNSAIDTLGLTEPVQIYVYGGRRYCWYDDGWNGEGWYWCGYQFRRGFGYGGGVGFRGWRGGGGFRRGEGDFRRGEGEFRGREGGDFDAAAAVASSGAVRRGRR